MPRGLGGIWNHVRMTRLTRRGSAGSDLSAEPLRTASAPTDPLGQSHPRTQSDASQPSASRKRTGLSRLAIHLRGRRLHVAGLGLVALGAASAPVAALLVVQDAIDNGMRAGDKSRLGRDVAVYLAINAVAWVLQTTMVRGLARVGQDLVLGLRRDLFDHLTTLSLRYFSQQKAGWIISRLTSDVDALSDVLSQGLSALVVTPSSAARSRFGTITSSGRCRSASMRGATAP